MITINEEKQDLEFIFDNDKWDLIIDHLENVFEKSHLFKKTSLI